MIKEYGGDATIPQGCSVIPQNGRISRALWLSLPLLAIDDKDETLGQSSIPIFECRTRPH